MSDQDKGIIVKTVIVTSPLNRQAGQDEKRGIDIISGGTWSSSTGRILNASHAAGFELLLTETGTGLSASKLVGGHRNRRKAQAKIRNYSKGIVCTDYREAYEKLIPQEQHQFISEITQSTKS